MAIILPLGAIAASFFIADRAGQRFLILYVAPLFLAAPIWVRTRLMFYGRRIGVAGIDAIVVGLSFARFVMGEILPFSGHMLFLTYSGLSRTTSGYRLLALVLWIETTWFKLVVWKDPMTWLVGLVLGAAAALISSRTTNRLTNG